jgi:hypothetical protein
MSPAIRACRALVAIYPHDFRARFSAGMLDALEAAARDHRHAGALARFRFGCVEAASLTLGCVREWAAKLTTDRAARGRCLPDLRMMRPAGVGRREWFESSGA